jgi:hypothetical protein
MLRRLLLVPAMLGAACVFAAPSFAARPGGFPHFVQSRHFIVWYTSDPLDPAYTTEGQASMLATLGDRAYEAETGWGYPAPLNDGDGLIDVYVEDLSATPDLLAFAQPDAVGPTSTGYIVFGRGSIDAADEGATIAHELFHLIQFDTWANPTQHNSWLFEGSAEWAAAKVSGFPGDLASASGPGDVSLDCRDPIAGFQMCDPDTYVEGGYSRWPFFQALAGRYGVTFLQTVLADGQAAGSSLVGLENAIGARGGSLADTYSDWSVQQMAGGYGIPALDVLVPTTFATISTGATKGPLSTIRVPVDHLATRYVTFTRGDGLADHPCFAATLTINVTIPTTSPQVMSRPYFYWNGKGSTPIALAVNGNKATTSVPWDTCLWVSNAGYLSLSNLSTDVDSVDFVVDSSLDVTDTPASPTSAPAGQSVYGPVTPVSNADTPPGITLFGPLLLQVSAAKPQLRLIVESTGDGKVHAMLGSVDLGSPDVRAGNNDLRFTLPKSLLSSLRRSSAAGNMLTLTPLSPSGAAIGTAVTRNVAVAAAPKPKAKPKKKKK